MKYYLSILLSAFICFNSFSQSAIEKELLNQLNVYRKSKGLGPMSSDTKLYDVALYHSRYLEQCAIVGHNTHYDKLPHDEQFDIKNHKEMNTDLRAAMYPDGNMYGEISMQSFLIDSTANVTKICKSIIDQFAGSPKHKEIMVTDFGTDKRLKPIVGISVIQVKSDIPGNYKYVVNIDFGVITF